MGAGASSVTKCFKKPDDSVPLIDRPEDAAVAANRRRPPLAPRAGSGPRRPGSRQNEPGRGSAGSHDAAAALQGQFPPPPGSVGSQESGGDARANLHLDMTPVKSQHMAARIEHTPVGSEADEFKFFCPLCMYHLKEILSTDCCNNYVCHLCAVQFLRGKGGLREALSSPPTSTPLQVACPHCGSTPHILREVSHEDEARQYDDDPIGRSHSKRLAESMMAERGFSPLKAGDTHEAMQRKMLRFGDFSAPAGHGPSNSVAGSVAGFPPDSIASPARSDATSIIRRGSGDESSRNASGDLASTGGMEAHPELASDSKEGPSGAQEVPEAADGGGDGGAEGGAVLDAGAAIGVAEPGGGNAGNAGEAASGGDGDRDGEGEGKAGGVLDGEGAAGSSAPAPARDDPAEAPQAPSDGAEAAGPRVVPQLSTPRGGTDTGTPTGSPNAPSSGRLSPPASSALSRAALGAIMDDRDDSTDAGGVDGDARVEPVADDAMSSSSPRAADSAAAAAPAASTTTAADVAAATSDAAVGGANAGDAAATEAAGAGDLAGADADLGDTQRPAGSESGSPRAGTDAEAGDGAGASPSAAGPAGNSPAHSRAGDVSEELTLLDVSNVSAGEGEAVGVSRPVGALQAPNSDVVDESVDFGHARVLPLDLVPDVEPGHDENAPPVPAA